MARISLSENGREGGENNKTLILNKVFITKKKTII